MTSLTSTCKIIPERRCSCCEDKIIQSYVYKCIICHDYELCSKCFEHRQASHVHENGHAVIRFFYGEDELVLFGKSYESLDQLKFKSFCDDFKNEIHDEIQCAICQTESIQGVRFKFESPEPFSLCLGCYTTEYILKSFKSEYTVVAIGKPTLTRIASENDFKIGKKLSRGNFGTVFEAELNWQNGQRKQVACKLIRICDAPMERSSLQLRKSYEREREAYTEIKGENILRLFGTFEKFDSANDTIELYLFIEYMQRGSLADLMNAEPSMSAKHRVDIAVGIASGMSRIHDLGYIHRDIRPPNILISHEYTPKIGDMGIAKLLNANSRNHTHVGDERYMPPEFHKQAGGINVKLDIFTFGLTLVELFGGRHECRKKKIRVTDTPKIMWSCVQPCLSRRASERPSSREIEKVLKDYQCFVKLDYTIENV